MSLNKEMLFAAFAAGQGCMSEGPYLRDAFEKWCAETQALKPPSTAVKPLDLANLIRHAFVSGAGIGDLERIPDDVQARSLEYDPTELSCYQRICAALESQKVNFNPLEKAPAIEPNATARKE